MNSKRSCLLNHLPLSPYLMGMMGRQDSRVRGRLRRVEHLQSVPGPEWPSGRPLSNVFWAAWVENKLL